MGCIGQIFFNTYSFLSGVVMLMGIVVAKVAYFYWFQMNINYKYPQKMSSFHEHLLEYSELLKLQEYKKYSP